MTATCTGDDGVQTELQSRGVNSWAWEGRGGGGGCGCKRMRAVRLWVRIMDQTSDHLHCSPQYDSVRMSDAGLPPVGAHVALGPAAIHARMYHRLPKAEGCVLSATFTGAKLLSALWADRASLTSQLLPS